MRYEDMRRLEVPVGARAFCASVSGWAVLLQLVTMSNMLPTTGILTSFINFFKRSCTAVSSVSGLSRVMGPASANGWRSEI